MTPDGATTATTAPPPPAETATPPSLPLLCSLWIPAFLVTFWGMQLVFNRKDPTRRDSDDR